MVSQRLHDSSRSENSGPRLLKIVDTTNNLRTHTLTPHDNLEVMEALLPIPSLSAYMKKPKSKRYNNENNLCLAGIHQRSHLLWNLENATLSRPHIRVVT